MGHWKANGCCGVDSSRSYFICLLQVDTARVDTLALAHAKKYKVSASEIFHVFAAWEDEVCERLGDRLAARGGRGFCGRLVAARDEATVVFLLKAEELGTMQQNRQNASISK
jgi:hypothetical protein